jgi:hypothetical protein
VKPNCVKKKCETKYKKKVKPTLFHQLQKLNKLFSKKNKMKPSLKSKFRKKNLSNKIQWAFKAHVSVSFLYSKPKTIPLIIPDLKMRNCSTQEKNCKGKKKVVQD